jgi:hypothetical protein
MWSRCGRFGLLLLNANSVHDIALHKFNLGQHRREFNLTMCIAQGSERERPRRASIRALGDPSVQAKQF